MFAVLYRRFSYPTQMKTFEAYEDARKYWNYMRVQYGVRYTELVPVETT